MEKNVVKVEKIFGADIYRDGGSYGFFFYSDDGHWYEFFLKTKMLQNPPSAGHLPPVIYLEGVNNRNVVQTLSWSQAKTFIAGLRYENQRLAELVDIIMREGEANHD